MSLRRTLLSLVALSVVVGLLPISGAQAAVNRAPKIKKAVMKDRNGDGMADRVVLTYNEKIKHKVDRRRFPFKVAGYRIKKINGAKGTRRLVILLKQNADAPLKPASISYKKTRKQPVTDMKGKQARKQFLTKNIVGLVATPPPPPVEHMLTVQRGGDGSGVVTSDPTGIDCGSACQKEFEEGTAVTLTATGLEGASLVGWTGCATNPTPDTCSVTMDAAKTVGATFAAAGSRTLNVAHAGGGAGTVSSSPAGVDCGSTCTGTFSEDTAVVELTAAPADNSKFMGWGGDATCPVSELTCNVVMDKDVENVTVTFDLLPVYTLTVAPTGGGSVTSTSDKSSTDQINCGSDCSGSYSEGTKVTLTAAPATGFVVGAWGGDATCSADTTTCEIPMDAAKSVTVTFVESPVMHSLTITKVGLGEVNCTVDLDPVACNDSFDEGTEVMIVATPTAPNVVATLSGDCDHGPLAVATCTVTMDASKEVTATFETAALPNVQQ